MEDKTVIRIASLIMIGVLFVLAFLVLKPILLAIVVGLILSYIFYPVYKLILKYVREKNVATSILILIITLAIAIPLWFLTPMMIRQAFDTYTALQKVNFGELLMNAAPSFFTPELGNIVSTSTQNLIGKAFSTFLTILGDLLVNLPQILLQFAVFIFTFYFVTRDADKLREYIDKLSPFSKSTETKLFSEFRHITDAIVYGQVLIGVIQGILLGVGLFVLGVPKALILTVVAVLVSIIPVLGSWLVWLPVSIFLIISGQTSSGIFLFLYGLLIVSTIDNILRPLFLSRNSNLNIALSVIGTIGGLYYFGIVGLVLGPLILAYILIIFDFYRQGKLSEIFKI